MFENGMCQQLAILSCFNGTYRVLYYLLHQIDLHAIA